MILMRIHRANCDAQTTDVFDFVDITDAVQAQLKSSGIADGQVTIFSGSDSCVLIVNERETGLHEDIRKVMRRLETADPRGGKGLLGSTSVAVPAVDGKLRLGMWQRLLLVELEKPDRRQVIVQVVGD
jgi:secondary thiamine-phosphate synthase enzyme